MEANEQINRFQEFLEVNCIKDLHILTSKGKKSLVINFNDLAEFDHELSEELLDTPEEVIKAAEFALDNLNLAVKKVRVRVQDLPKIQEIKIRNIRSEHINKFLAFDGIVKQSSDVRPQIVSAKFECPSCGNTLSILQIDPQFREPTRCSCGRRGKFRLLSKDLVDVQRLLVEECPESLEGGEQPKKLNVFLKEDLVEPKMENKTTPGSKIRVIGVIKEVPIHLRSGTQSVRYDLVAEANYIQPIEQTFEDIEINEDDERDIKELAKDKNVFSKFINSIAPTIYGYEKIKEAIVLQLMGGVKKTKEDRTQTRGDIHVLLVGDPGAGKTQLLQFISKTAPKARFVAGKGASAAGITATVVRDEFLKGWALEAGALVLSNKGLLALDEMDKMSEEDRSAMHEAMESQVITISKANIQASLRAETTILAAANPRLGRFDPYHLIASQINLPPTLLSRFDLIFPIRDIPNKEKDDKIASHVLHLHKSPEEIKTEIPINLFKKYISYAKQRVFPKLTEEAINEMKKFYIDLRNRPSTRAEEEVKPIPITARQLEALVRLAEASARVRLAEKVTKKDARVAIELLKHCLMQVGFDYETGEIDIDRISTGISASQRSRIGVVRDIILELEKRVGKSIQLDDVIAEASIKGIDEAQVEEVIERLKREGEIYEPKRGTISKL